MKVSDNLQWNEEVQRQFQNNQVGESEASHSAGRRAVCEGALSAALEMTMIEGSKMETDERPLGLGTTLAGGEDGRRKEAPPRSNSWPAIWLNRPLFWGVGHALKPSQGVLVPLISSERTLCGTASIY